MRDQIKEVLAKYAAVQVNLSSQSARDMITEEICDIVLKRNTDNKEPVRAFEAK